LNFERPCKGDFVLITGKATGKKNHSSHLRQGYCQSPACAVLICVALLLLSVIASAQALGNFADKIISRITVVSEISPQPESVEELRSLLRVREGGRYLASDIRRSLLALHDSGRVANARVEATEQSDGTVAISFIILPQVRIRDVDFRGLVGLEQDELRSRLTDLERGTKFSDAAVQRGAERIYEALRDRGYFQVSVEPEIRYDATRTGATITYNVTMRSQATLGNITFNGAPRIAENTLRQTISSRPGLPFSLSQINADIQKLLELHLRQNYLDARIAIADQSYEDATNKLNLALSVISGPKFSLKVDGYKYDDKQLRELLPLLREGGVNEAVLDESARRLRENMQEQGFFFAEVTPAAVPDLTKETAELTFTIEPNERYRVTEIRIQGTDKLTYAEVADDLRSKTESFIPIPILTKYTRGITSEQSLRRDLETILGRLRDLGFRKARRVSINRAVNPDNDQLRIIFTIAEGPRSYVGDIAFRGNTLLDANELRRLLQLETGQPFSFSRARDEGSRILQNYFERGYALATVSLRTVELAPDASGEKVRLIYEITEGPLVYVNRVVVSNQGFRKRTSDKRVREYLTFTDGDRLNQDALSRSEQELYATGAFRRVQMRTEPLGEERETGEVRRNIFVDVDEGRSRELLYGVGYQSDEGARGIIGVTDPNLFGRLTTGSLRFRGSPRNLLAQASYTDPRPFGHNAPTLLSLLVQKQVREAFESRRGTLLLQLERRLSERSLVLFRYNYESVRVTNPDQVIDRRDLPIRLSRVSSSYAFDGRDNPFDARTGRYHTFDFSFAARALGGNEQFLRFFTENQYHYTLPRSGGTVFASNLRVGLSRNIGTRADLPPDLTEREKSFLPITERFFAGGSTTLRGYGFEQAGPRDFRVTTATTDNADGTKTTTTSYDSRPIGGNAFIAVNAELRRNVYKQLGLVGFYDTGNVFGLMSDIRLRDFSHTVGLGLRVRTGLGPVRFDIGWLMSDLFRGSNLTADQINRLQNPGTGASSRYNPSRLRFHLSFGQAF
jgi:outer membrane protein insertion porin family